MLDAAKDRGIWASNGLDPEFVYAPLTVEVLKEQVASGIKIGLSTAADALWARSIGVPLKIVAGLQSTFVHRIFVKADGPINTVKDLDGRKIGVRGVDDPSSRAVGYVSNRFAIKPILVPLVNATNMVVALKLGKIDAFNSPESFPLRLVDSGELRILLHVSDIVPKPLVSIVIWATDDLIEQNPDLVKRFVKASLETVKYLKENPSYAKDLYIKKTNAPKDLADKAIGEKVYTPGMRGSELTTALTNAWKYAKDSGAVSASTNVKIEEAVDTRFLP